MQPRSSSAICSFVDVPRMQALVEDPCPMKDMVTDITDTVLLMKPRCLERSRLRMKGMATAITDTALLMKQPRQAAFR